jgi:hypothetical protein
VTCTGFTLGGKTGGKTGPRAFAPSSRENAYAEAVAHLRGRRQINLRGKATRLVAETRVVAGKALSDSVLAIYYHETAIVTYYPDGRIVLDSGGYDTVTNREKMKEYVPGLRAWLQDSVLHVVTNAAHEPLVEEAKLACNMPLDGRRQPALWFGRDNDTVTIWPDALMTRGDETRLEAEARIARWREEQARPKPARRPRGATASHQLALPSC